MAAAPSANAALAAALSQPPKEMMDSSFWCSLIGLRREVHMHPEPGFQEIRTQARVKEVLMKFAGLKEEQFRNIAKTGWVVDIPGTGPANPDAKIHCIALRSDLDALTMTEGNNGLPYRSKNEGIAHMCGHDGHITALVGAAILVQRKASQLPSNCKVRLLFQPAEESTPPGTAGYDFKQTGGGGAVPMIMEGCLEGVDEVYGWHNWPTWSLGTLAVKVGASMAHCCSFTIVVKGRGGHGSQPQACVDPIVCGAALVSSLQTIVSRSLPSWSTAVVTVAQFHAGERNNVIPDTARLSGTIRDVDETVSATIKRRFHDLVNGTCKAYGCTAEVEILSQYPCVMNHKSGVEVVQRCAQKLTGSMKVNVTEEGLPLMGGEDFSFFLKERPGCFFFLGTQELLLRGLSTYDGAEDTPRSNCMCHGTTFDFNDNVLPRAVLMFVRIVEDRFGVELYSQEEVLKANFGLLGGAGAGAGAGADGPAEKRPRTG